MKRCFVIFVLFSTFLFASCSGKKSPITMGELDGICYPNGTCNEGLICDEESNLCVKIEFSDDSENNDTDTENDDSQNDISADTSSDDIDSSDSVADNTDTIQDSDSDTNSGKNQGELYGECYPNNTCNEGLICDVENNICIKDPGNSEEPEDDSDNIENTDNDTDTDSGDQVSDNDTDTTDSGNDSGDSTTDNDADSIIFDPCESDPCSEITYSTGLCTMTDEGYTCGCLEHYLWNGSVCKAVSIEDVDCIGKPENAVWNTVDKIRQTWDGEEWYPSNEAVYNTNPSDKECRFICDTDFTWNGTECESTVSNYLPLGRICTGQEKCYANGRPVECSPTSGQDALYANQGVCTPKSFTITSVLGDKIIIDNNTGLIWQQSPSSTTGYKFNEAQNYCMDLSYAGYSNNWRLPSPQEVLSIVDHNNTKIESNFNLPENILYYWTSIEKYRFGPTGWFYLSDISNGGYFFCVHGDEMQKGSFSEMNENGKNVVIDSTTNLMWQKEYVKDKLWKEALKYCSDLNDENYAGHKDWRLPNENELASLLNHDKSEGPYSDFPGMPSLGFWSSTSVTVNTSAYGIHFGTGLVDGGGESWHFSVRCVRNAD